MHLLLTLTSSLLLLVVFCVVCYCTLIYFISAVHNEWCYLVLIIPMRWLVALERSLFQIFCFLAVFVNWTWICSMSKVIVTLRLSCGITLVQWYWHWTSPCFSNFVFGCVTNPVNATIGHYITSLHRWFKCSCFRSWISWQETQDLKHEHLNHMKYAHLIETCSIVVYNYLDIVYLHTFRVSLQCFIYVSVLAGVVYNQTVGMQFSNGQTTYDSWMNAELYCRFLLHLHINSS